MSIPSKFIPFFPIKRTGSADNERVQLNKLLRLIIGELGISQEVTTEESLEELIKRIEILETGDASTLIWGMAIGDLENQEDLWNELQSKVENLGEVNSLQADVIASRPAAGNVGSWFLSKDERKLYYDDGAVWQLLLSIDHTDLENVGTNTHTQIDAHIADTSIHFSDLSGFTTDGLSEGITNLYYTDARASAAAPVQSVDGQTGVVDLSASYEVKRKNNLNAITDPTVNDDNTLGYEPLSRWINTTDGEVFLCVSAATGAADWQQKTLTLDELGSAALVDVGTLDAQVPTNADLNIGDWDTAFSWGDHAAAGYELAGNLGSLAYVAPGGTANQLQVNDGAGGLAGIPVTYSAGDLNINGTNALKVGDFGLGTDSPTQLSTNDAAGEVRFFRGLIGDWGVGNTVGINLARVSTRNYQLMGRTDDSEVHLYAAAQNGSGAWLSPVEFWHSGNLEYDTDTVTLGGDFDSGQQVKCTRVGDQVTITTLGALAHDDSTSIFALTAIDSKYRPAHDQLVTFYVSSSVDLAATLIVGSNGIIQLAYETVSGTGSASQVAMPAPTSITYNV